MTDPLTVRLGKLVCGNPEMEVNLDLLIRDVNRTIAANERLDPQGTRCDLRLLCMAVERLAAERAALNARVEEARGVIERLANWRKTSAEYTDSMNLPRRKMDEAQVIHMEAEARAYLTKEASDDEG